MQKYFCVLLLALFSLSAAGCNNRAPDEKLTTSVSIDNNSPEAKSAPGAGPPNPAMGVPGPRKKGTP